METLEIQSELRAPGHPWVQLSDLPGLPDSVRDGDSLGLLDVKGQSLGCGILDRNDCHAAWRRYTQAEAVPFDESYIATALAEAIERRADESCQRLVSSDADYLPGLVAELYGDVVWVSLETAAVRAHVDLIVELLNETVNPVEIVLDRGEGPQTCSGQGLKGRWVEVDGLFYRIDLLNQQKPRFYLDQREQHALVGSLCEGRAVLDLFSHSGAFAIQAMYAGAEQAVAVDLDEHYVKAIGANAQKNQVQVEAVATDALGYLQNADAGSFDAIVIDPPSAFYGVAKFAQDLHQQAFAHLSQGGILATYCRNPDIEFEALVAEAAAVAGREARIFARTSQPFDFPLLLNFPESQCIRGLILQVE